MMDEGFIASAPSKRVSKQRAIELVMMWWKRESPEELAYWNTHGTFVGPHPGQEY